MSVTKVVILALVLLVISSVCCTASVPPMINYQGKLMQPSGAPVPDNTYSMQFAIYDVPTGGTALWSETNPTVHVKGGLFATMLGSITNLPANIFDNPDRWFGVTVGSDPEMMPRQKIASVGYAQVAGKAQTVEDGAITTTKLAIGVATPAGTISMFGGATAPTGWLLCNGAAVSRTAYPSLFATIGTTFGPGDGTTTFNTPDFRGVFPKGAGTTNRPAGEDAAGVFYAASLGAYSTDRMQGHRHSSMVVASMTGGTDTWCMNFVGSNANFLTNYGAWQVLNPKTDGVNGTPRTGSATEPQSLGVNYIIKY